MFFKEKQGASVTVVNVGGAENLLLRLLYFISKRLFTPEYLFKPLIIADKKINAREEITVDYTKQPYLEQPKEDWK